MVEQSVQHVIFGIDPVIASCAVLGLVYVFIILIYTSNCSWVFK